MFIIPTSDVLLLGTVITIVLAAVQWFISGASPRTLRVRPEDGRGKAWAKLHHAA